MHIEGTIVGGRVEFDEPIQLPNGTRVRVELADDSLFPVPEPYDRDAELSALRESLRDAAAGRGKSARACLDELAKKHKLPSCGGE